MPASPHDIRTEAAKILELVREPFAAVQVLERQLGVLVLRTQVLLSLSGIVITVTGFSGRAIAETSNLARAAIAGGILLVLLSAATAFWGVLRLQWITQVLENDVTETLVRAIGIRNRKSRYLLTAIVLFVIGLGLYVAAIAQLLWAAQPRA